MARKKQPQYEEQPGWMSAFRRPDNEDPQPRYTGQGLLEDGTEVEVAVWVRRAKSGVQYLRIKIQPPYEAEDYEDDEELDDDEDEPTPPPARSKRAGQKRTQGRRRPKPEPEDDEDIPF